MLSNSKKQSIVFLKDVKYQDLRALVDFMYRGEVTVAKEHLASFLNTAESLKIKGLADKDIPDIDLDSKASSTEKQPRQKSPRQAEVHCEAVSKLNKTNGRATPQCSENMEYHSTPNKDVLPVAQNHMNESFEHESHFVGVETQLETEIEIDEEDNQIDDTENNTWPFQVFT